MEKKKKTEATEKELERLLEEVKKDLEELREKLGMTEETDLTKLPLEVLSKVRETASEVAGKALEVVKSAAKIAEKSVEVVKSGAIGAVEGAKKAIKEEQKSESQVSQEPEEKK